MKVRVIDFQNFEKKLYKAIIELKELDNGKVELTFNSPNCNSSKIGLDYFSALQTLRSSLEDLNINLLCNGASKDVYPSGMIRDMGDGNKAYRLRQGFHASRDDIVDIFEYDSKNYIACTVQEQENYFLKWQQSRKKFNGSIPRRRKITYTKEWLIKEQNEKENLDHLFFWGHHPKKLGLIDKSCLSQWYPCVFRHENFSYSTAEHWMMAEKARLFNDEETLTRILKVSTPKEAKLLGRQVKHFEMSIWDKHKLMIVINGNYLKFNQDSQLKNFLIDTENKILVEASPNDRIWGIGMRQDEKGTKNPKHWKGENLLGFALMEVRDMLKSK